MICTMACNEIENEVCCDPEKLGKFVKVISGVRRRYIACPNTAPDWCT